MNSEPISTTELSRRLGVGVSVKLLLELGLVPFVVDGVCHWWDEDDYIEICEKVAGFLMKGGSYLK